MKELSGREDERKQISGEVERWRGGEAERRRGEEIEE